MGRSTSLPRAGVAHMADGAGRSGSSEAGVLAFDLPVAIPVTARVERGIDAGASGFVNIRLAFSSGEGGL